MPFMLLILVVIVVVAVKAFLDTSPRVEGRGRLIAFNAIILALSVPAGVVAGTWIFQDAVARKPDETGIAIYLGIMAGGTVALLVVALGGLLRNFAIYPRSRRLPPVQGGSA